MNKVIQGDCLIKLKELEDNSVDAIVTDPPYELGFMGKSWDNTGIAYNVDMWKECLRVLKPGGHLLAFGGTRTYHRMAVAIEDAGFEIRDMINWCYGSGFPKSLNIGKAVDKLQGNEREVVGDRLTPDGKKWSERRPNGIKSQFKEFNKSKEESDKQCIDTKGASEWEGWGSSLKPSHEPIAFCRKPLEKGLNIAENCLKWGTGGINIDESRIGNDKITINRHSGYNSNSLVESTKGKWKGKQEQISGRFPANLILSWNENEYIIKESITNEQKQKALKWIYENA